MKFKKLEGSKDFDINYYNEENKKVIDMIKERLPLWETEEGFIADGLVNPQTYNELDVKIICFLSESYGWQKQGCVDIQKQRRKGGGQEARDNDIIGLLNSKIKTARFLTSFLYLVYNFFESDEPISKEDFINNHFLTSNIPNNKALQGVLEKTAWINVKKLSENKGHSENYDDVYSNALKNKEILKKQIEITRPNIIFVFSNVANDSLCDMGLLGGIKKDNKGLLQKNEFGQYVMHLDHPSVWFSYEKIYDNFETFRDNFLSLN